MWHRHTTVPPPSHSPGAGLGRRHIHGQVLPCQPGVVKVWLSVLFSSNARCVMLHVVWLEAQDELFDLCQQLSLDTVRHRRTALRQQGSTVFSCKQTIKRTACLGVVLAYLWSHSFDNVVCCEIVPPSPLDVLWPARVAAQPGTGQCTASTRLL
jgi:hypothetical protein